MRQNLIAMLVADDKLGQARERIDGWFRASKTDPDALVRLVAPALDRLPDDEWTRKRRVAVWRAAREARPQSGDLLAGLASALDRAGKAAEALALLDREREQARGDTDRLLALIPAYGKLSSTKAARQALLEISAALVENRPLDASIRRVHLDQLKSEGLTEQVLAAIEDWRRYAPGFPDLVVEHAAMLRELGQKTRAERVLSELVEFNPHDFQARSLYAATLAGQGRPVDACAQYTRAVQLNPAKRDTFRTMMAMRRSHPGAAKAIRKCILDGVSRLPVIRDVSIVMLWEDPSADIDMHVIEAGGERVWYQHQESKQGGHLYYDVTDGFGPEIYVLGSAKPGTYRLQVVYYSGSTPKVRGKFILMRNAGGPEETRREYPFILKSANSSKKVPITTFKISR